MRKPGVILHNFYYYNKKLIYLFYSKYSSYNRYITLGRETVQAIYDKDSFDDSGVYRIEKGHHRTVNDALAMGSFGISHSSSTLNAAPIQFLRKLGFSYGGHYIKYKGSKLLGEPKQNPPSKEGGFFVCIILFLFDNPVLLWYNNY